MKFNYEGKDYELTNDEVVERINAWQNAGFVHPLTCRWKSSHANLKPIIKKGSVILICPDCKREQLTIPEPVLSVSPQQLNEEKQRLINIGFIINEKPEIKIPRRINMQEWTAAELSIFNAMQEVEKMGAHPILTKVVILLERAKSWTADYVDSVNPENK